MTAPQPSTADFLICMAAAIVLGLGCSLLAGFRSRCTQSYRMTLAILPAVITPVILLVSDNIGAGLCIAGTFSLIRFRSARGSAREICLLFLSAAIGFCTGLGYVYLAAGLFFIIAIFLLLLVLTNFGSPKKTRRVLKIMLAENLDYEGLFDDLFRKYTDSAELTAVKTNNMGTMYELRYEITLKENRVPKEFWDEIRCRNSNLGVSCAQAEDDRDL